VTKRERVSYLNIARKKEILKRKIEHVIDRTEKEREK
jgi:hypothetical protein